MESKITIIEKDNNPILFKNIKKRSVFKFINGTELYMKIEPHEYDEGKYTAVNLTEGFIEEIEDDSYVRLQDAEVTITPHKETE